MVRILSMISCLPIQWDIVDVIKRVILIAMIRLSQISSADVLRFALDLLSNLYLSILLLLNHLSHLLNVGVGRITCAE